jgi:hypothetical protein
MKRTTALLILCLITAGACRKQEQKPVTPPAQQEEKICRLTEEKYPDGSGTTYILDTNGNMVESRTTMEAGFLWYVSVFEYTGGVLSSIVDYYDEEKTRPKGKLTYERDGDKITIRRYDYDVAYKEFIEKFRKIQTVDAKDHLAKEDVWNLLNGEMTLTSVNEYKTDDRGNITMQKAYQDDTLKNTWTYEYDNKPSWKLGHQAYTVMKISPNNMVKVMIWDKNGNITYQETYAYDYNAEGYPSSGPGGSTYTYKCRE